MLAKHAAFLSDPRLQFHVLDPAATAEIDGRVIGHVLDEVSERPHALIEGVDGIVYYVPHDGAIAEARANGGMKPNAFVPFRMESVGERAVLTVNDLGDADKLLSNHDHMKRTVQRLLQRGILQEPEQPWSGWLGRYHATLRAEIEAVVDTPQRSPAQQRGGTSRARRLPGSSLKVSDPRSS